MSSVTLISADQFELRLYQLYRAEALKKDPYGRKHIEHVSKLREPMDIEQILNNFAVVPHPPKSLVEIVKGFTTVENLLPDYVTQILNLVRESMGRMYFTVLWASEEARHGLMLTMWLEAVGAFTLLDSIALYDAGTRTEWDPKRFNSDFGDPVYGAIYTTFQEKYTAYGYYFLRLFAERCGQLALAQLCRRLEKEEMGHHAFYLKICQLINLHQPERLRTLIYRVHDDFAMPGRYADLPSYNRWTVNAIQEGVVPDPRLTNELIEQPLNVLNAVQVRPEKQVRKVECWATTMRGIAAIFTQLGLPVPPNLEAALLGYDLIK